jgi:D-glycero-alpha-D-manno-heptose 1-phosphate guanylyltransferase
MMKTAVILAGGLGTRLRSAVPNLPKPMAPINGKPFLAALLNYWVSQGITRFVISLGYKSQTIIDYFGASFNGADIEYVVEMTPLGTGGALLLVNQRLDSNCSFFLLNGDTYFEVEAKNLSNLAIETNADWCFSLFKTSEIDRYHRINLGEHNEILDFNSPKTRLTQYLANGGVYLVRSRILNALNIPLSNQISLENEIFPLLISQEKRIFGLIFDTKFIDIGVPDDYQRAHELLKK